MTTPSLAPFGDDELIAELTRRGITVYLVGRADDLAAEYPRLAHSAIFAGMQRVKEAIGNNSIPETLGDITFAVFAEITEAVP